MPSYDARRRLAEAQERLLRALAGHGQPPEDFDAGRVRAAAEALAHKRARTVARAWPGLARALGADFAGSFSAFAANSPLPRAGGPLADGRAFAAHLASRGQLPDAGRLEALAVDLRYRRMPDGLKPRRGPAFLAAWLRGSGRLVLAVRLPWLGEQQISLPWWRGTPSSASSR
jgi:hypothetical protein